MVLFFGFCLKNDINCVQQTDPMKKCLPKSVIFGMLPKLFTEMLNGRQYLLVDTTLVCILNSILFNCLIQTKKFMNDVFYCWFSSNSSNTLRFMELCEWRLHCWIHTRWTNVNSAPILPIVCCIWFIFHFNALVHLYHGKRIHIDLIESNLIVSHLLSVWCFIDERRKHC